MGLLTKPAAPNDVVKSVPSVRFQDRIRERRSTSSNEANAARTISGVMAEAAEAFLFMGIPPSDDDPRSRLPPWASMSAFPAVALSAAGKSSVASSSASARDSEVATVEVPGSAEGMKDTEVALP